MRNLVTVFLIALLCVLTPFYQVSAMTSTNYQINWSSVNSGGDDVSSSTNFRIRDTIGDQATGFSSSTIFQLSAGYRAADSDLPALSFRLGTQEDATQVAYTFFSTTSSQVIVNSSASFSAGNLIGVVEDLGLNQLVAVGRITEISGSVITVDRWDGTTSTMSTTPSGGDDYVYRMTGSTAALGVLSATTGKTALTATDVSSNGANGYTVYISDDGNLRSASSSIINVSDGTVSVGSEEYGYRTRGQRAVNNSQDQGFSTSTASIQSSTAQTTESERVGVIYKISIANNSTAGSYSHVVYYTLTANY